MQAVHHGMARTSKDGPALRGLPEGCTAKAAGTSCAWGLSESWCGLPKAACRAASWLAARHKQLRMGQVRPPVQVPGSARATAVRDWQPGKHETSAPPGPASGACHCSLVSTACGVADQQQQGGRRQEQQPARSACSACATPLTQMSGGAPAGPQEPKAGVICPWGVAGTCAAPTRAWTAVACPDDAAVGCAGLPSCSQGLKGAGMGGPPSEGASLWCSSACRQGRGRLEAQCWGAGELGCCGL